MSYSDSARKKLAVAGWLSRKYSSVVRLSTPSCASLAWGYPFVTIKSNFIFGNVTKLNEFIFGNVTKLNEFIFGNITKKVVSLRRN